jgi:hypothetical protein
MAELRTEQLECMLTSLIPNSTTVSVLGVYPADRIPLKASVDASGARTLYTGIHNTELPTNIHCCFILNTHPHDKPGEHWLAFFYNNNTHTLEYFDSFGMELSAYVDVYSSCEQCNLIDMLRPVNTLGMLQSPQSAVCGHYCVAFLYWRARHCTRPRTLFSISIAAQGSPTQRDKYIVRLMHTLLSRRSCPYDTLSRSAQSQSCTCCRI